MLAANTTSLPDRNLDADTQYCYRVTAANAFGTSATSAAACATTTSDAVAPLAPGNAASVAVSSSAIDLSWQDLSDNETEFRVNRQVAGGSWLELVRVGAGVTAHSDTGLDAETAYCYEVIASNAVGDSPASGATCATTDAAGAAPAEPGNVSATAVSSSGIDVSWADSSDNEDEFRIERQRAGGAWTALSVLAANTTSLPDRGLDADTQYCYRVTAANAFGASATSSAACATTSAAGVAPAAPGSVSANAVSASGIDVSWADSSDNEDEFRVERRRAGSAWRAVSVLSANTTSLADRGLNDHTRYCYRVTAVNAFGNSATSSVACARTSAVARPPRTPRRLRIARRYVGGIDLTWRDRSNNETGFNVYRKLKHGGAWQLVGTAPANSARFSDTSVSRRKRYCYVVRAANGSGESSNSNRRCTRAR